MSGMFTKNELDEMRKIVISDFVIGADHAILFERMKSIGSFDEIDRPVTFLHDPDLTILSLRSKDWALIRSGNIGRGYRDEHASFLVQEHKEYGRLMLVISPLSVLRTESGRNNFHPRLTEYQIAFYYGPSEAVKYISQELGRFERTYPDLMSFGITDMPLEIVLQLIKPNKVGLTPGREMVDPFLVYREIMGSHYISGDNNYRRCEGYTVHCDEAFNFTFLSDELSVYDLQKKVADIRQVCIEKFGIKNEQQQPTLGGTHLQEGSY